jgi:hypothetical protein
VRDVIGFTFAEPRPHAQVVHLEREIETPELRDRFRSAGEAPYLGCRIVPRHGLAYKVAHAEQRYTFHFFAARLVAVRFARGFTALRTAGASGAQ